MDHPESTQAIEDDCSICHMITQPVRLADRDCGKAHSGVFAFSIAKFPKGTARQQMG